MHPQLPHLYMPLGTDELADECRPIIPAMVDSCAAVNTMRSQWIFPIVKRYPYIVKAVVDSRDGLHSPLILCGVVGNTDVLNKLSTKLLLMIELFTSFRTSSGEEISLQFSCGDNVSVNCILGMPYFKQFGVVLDTVHHKVIAQKVDCNPFGIS